MAVEVKVHVQLVAHFHEEGRSRLIVLDKPRVRRDDPPAAARRLERRLCIRLLQLVVQLLIRRGVRALLARIRLGIERDKAHIAHDERARGVADGGVLHAVGQACDRLKDGVVDVALALMIACRKRGQLRGVPLAQRGEHGRVLRQGVILGQIAQIDHIVRSAKLLRHKALHGVQEGQIALLRGGLQIADDDALELVPVGQGGKAVNGACIKLVAVGADRLILIRRACRKTRERHAVADHAAVIPRDACGVHVRHGLGVPVVLPRQAPAELRFKAALVGDPVDPHAIDGRAHVQCELLWRILGRRRDQLQLDAARLGGGPAHRSRARVRHKAVVVAAKRRLGELRLPQSRFRLRHGRARCEGGGVLVRAAVQFNTAAADVFGKGQSAGEGRRLALVGAHGGGLCGAQDGACDGQIVRHQTLRLHEAFIRKGGGQRIAQLVRTHPAPDRVEVPACRFHIERLARQRRRIDRRICSRRRMVVRGLSFHARARPDEVVCKVGASLAAVAAAEQTHVLAVLADDGAKAHHAARQRLSRLEVARYAAHILRAFAVHGDGACHIAVDHAAAVGLGAGDTAHRAVFAPLPIQVDVCIHKAVLHQADRAVVVLFDLTRNAARRLFNAVDAAREDAVFHRAVQTAHQKAAACKPVNVDVVQRQVLHAARAVVMSDVAEQTHILGSEPYDVQIADAVSLPVQIAEERAAHAPRLILLGLGCDGRHVTLHARPRFLAQHGADACHQLAHVQVGR